MKIKPLLFTLLASAAFITAAHAQQGVSSAGGDITGAGGTMSFSTGQTDFMYFSSEAGSIQFGLQQVFFFEDADDPEVPANQTLSTNDLNQGEAQCFGATQNIVLAGGSDTFIVEAGTGVELIAGNSIRMLPGTKVEPGGYMHARITSSDGPFCDIEEPMVASLQNDDLAGHETYQGPLYEPGNEAMEKPFFRVYPNPTSGDFTVEITAGNADLPYTIEVYGMRGEVIIRNDRLTNWQHQLSLEGQQPGLYMIRVQQGDQAGVERIIKR